MSYVNKGLTKTQLKRDNKAALLAAIQADLCTPSHGMTKEEAVTILSQDIADYEAILGRLRHAGSTQ